jgi:hypothetical protein
VSAAAATRAWAEKGVRQQEEEEEEEGGREGGREGGPQLTSSPPALQIYYHFTSPGWLDGWFRGWLLDRDKAAAAAKVRFPSGGKS